MERKLINYLPYAVREFTEYRGIATGEQPEFELVWNAEQEVFDNQFIDTAQDYGLSRWEKMLDIFPKGTDTLETRRARIKARLNNFIPYPFRVLVRMLTAISNGEPFSVSIDPGTYLLKLVTQWNARGQTEGLEHLLKNIVPCNIALDAENRLLCFAEGVALAFGGVCFVNSYFITNDWQEKKTVEGDSLIGGSVLDVERWFITNDENRDNSIPGNVCLGNGLSYTGSYLITNDSQEDTVVEGTAVHGAAVPNAVHVVITEDFREQFKIHGEGPVNSGMAITEHIEID